MEPKRPGHEFHVVSNRIRILFDVPLPAAGIDDVLRDLLLHHGREIIRYRKSSGQPLDGIDRATVFAKRGTEDVVVGTLDLGIPEELSEIEMPRLLPIGASPEDDPLRRLGNSDSRKVVSLGETTRLDDLAPLGSEVRLTAGLAAGLRSLGTDPHEMTASQLAMGLLEIAGYSLTPRSERTYVVSGTGLSTLLYLVDHQQGTYPELGEDDIAEFLVEFASSYLDRGLLVTDKYGPYEIYEKERANPRCHFITRERIQGFVDSIALG